MASHSPQCGDGFAAAQGGAAERLAKAAGATFLAPAVAACQVVLSVAGPPGTSLGAMRTYGEKPSAALNQPGFWWVCLHSARSCIGGTEGGMGAA